MATAAENGSLAHLRKLVANGSTKSGIAGLGVRWAWDERTCWNCGMENMECQPRAGTWHHDTRLLQLKELKRKRR